jgi:hypothetical protein
MAVISPVTGTRITPIDGYQFIRGSTATFHITFTSDGRPVNVDTATSPTLQILQPTFLTGGSAPTVVTLISGALTAGQNFEYEFTWDVPINSVPLDNYVAVYSGIVGGTSYIFQDEYFTITAQSGQVGAAVPSYATLNDLRMMRWNIDDYAPDALRSDLTARNQLFQYHLTNATNKLREELNLHRSRLNTENYKLFTIYYAVYTILLASRGENGSSVSDQNLTFWRSEANKILEQEKRRSLFQGLPISRG